MSARIVSASMARAFLTESPICLPRCLPLRIFYAGKIAKMPAAQEQQQKVSDLPPKADIAQHGGNVRFVPEAEIAAVGSD
jgi:hypothetical protein